MVNLDMIGRLKNRTLYAFGVKTGKEFADLLGEVNQNPGLTLTLGGDGYGPSDHTSFYARGVPSSSSSPARIPTTTDLRTPQTRSTGKDWPRCLASCIGSSSIWPIAPRQSPTSR